MSKINFEKTFGGFPDAQQSSGSLTETASAAQEIKPHLTDVENAENQSAAQPVLKELTQQFLEASNN